MRAAWLMPCSKVQTMIMMMVNMPSLTIKYFYDVIIVEQKNHIFV